MKIGIVTFHFAYNFGAVLQAWALQTYLTNLGHQVEFINYRPKYHTERYQLLRDVLKAGEITYYKKHSGILRAIRAVVGTGLENVLLFKERWNKKKVFELFIQTQIKQTPVYHYIKEIQADNRKYDVLIAGSDQIWNRKLTNDDFDPVYFLEFGEENARRIIYAVSLGETSVKDCTNFISQCKFSLDNISCREKMEASRIEQELGKSCSFVPDPTLLIDDADYDRILSTPKESNYILVYILKTNEVMNEVLKQLVYNGWKVINISPIRISVKGMRNIYPISPSEFLGYIKNAKIVFTNSFHGTILSIIFKKNFACGLHGTRNQRILNLLNEVGLAGRVINEPSQFDPVFRSDIDYNSINAEINKLSLRGKEYLKIALQS